MNAPRTGRVAYPRVVSGVRLFVYGSLRRGEALHAHLAGLACLGPAWMRGRLYDLGEYPGAVPSRRAGERVQGEVYELAPADERLAELDRLEGCDPERPERGLFVRRARIVELAAGGRLRAWVYLLPRLPAQAVRIPGGDHARRGPRSPLDPAGGPS